MLQEHAITYSESLSLYDVEQLVRKANQLGRSGRNVTRVHEECDEEGKHIYFNVQGLSYVR